MGKLQNWWRDTVKFLNEVKAELKNVTWPTKEQTVGSTGVVLIAVVLIAAFIWVVDIFLQKLVTLIL